MTWLDDPTLIVATLGLLGTITVGLLNTKIEHRLTKLEVKTGLIWDYHKSEIPLGLKNPSEFHDMLDMMSADINLINDFDPVSRGRFVKYLKTRAVEESTEMGSRARFLLKMIRIEVGDHILA